MRMFVMRSLTVDRSGTARNSYYGNDARSDGILNRNSEKNSECRNNHNPATQTTDRTDYAADQRYARYFQQPDYGIHT